MRGCTRLASARCLTKSSIWPVRHKAWSSLQHAGPPDVGIDAMIGTMFDAMIGAMIDVMPITRYAPPPLSLRPQ